MLGKAVMRDQNIGMCPQTDAIGQWPLLLTYQNQRPTSQKWTPLHIWQRPLWQIMSTTILLLFHSIIIMIVLPIPKANIMMQSA